MSRPRSARAIPIAFAVIALLGCFGAGAGPEAAKPVISDEEALRFAQRAESFYQSLQGLSLPAMATFQNRDLHQYFATPSAYADYYSSLATSARQAVLRDRQANSVRIREFHFDGPDQAVVEVVLTGKHERALRFWNIDLDRRDVWRRMDGIWVIVPDKL